MATLIDLVHLAPSRIAEIVDDYYSAEEPTRVSMAAGVPVCGGERTMDDAYRIALALADGDHRRLERLPDRSVIVHNKPRRRWSSW